MERIKVSEGQVLYDEEAFLNDTTSRSIYFSEPDNILPDSMKVRDFCPLSFSLTAKKSRVGSCV